MKQLITICALFLSTLSVFGQEAQAIKSQMSVGVNEGWRFAFANISEKDAVDVWTDLLKSEYKAKTKYNKKTKEHFTDNANISAVSKNTVDVYTTSNKIGDSTIVNIWFDLGGAYLQPAMHMDRMPGANLLFADYKRLVDIRSTEDLLDQEEKILKSLQSDLDKMKKEQSGLEDDIKKYQDKIKSAEAEIEVSIKNQTDKDGTIKDQNEVIENIRTRLATLKGKKK